MGDMAPKAREIGRAVLRGALRASITMQRNKRTLEECVSAVSSALGRVRPAYLRFAYTVAFPTQIHAITLPKMIDALTSRIVHPMPGPQTAIAVPTTLPAALDTRAQFRPYYVTDGHVDPDKYIARCPHHPICMCPRCANGTHPEGCFCAGMSCRKNGART